MKYAELYEKNAKKYERWPALKKTLLILNAYLPLLFLTFYVGFFGYAILSDEPLKEDFPFFVFLPLCSLAVVSALRLLIARPRPYSEDGANITPMVNKKGNKTTSCPSRHIACAVAISLAFIPFSLPIAILLLVASVALAYFRFSVGVHYISDLIYGACVPAAISVFFLVIQQFM